MSSVVVGAREWFRVKVAAPVVEWLKQGAEPSILARSAGSGFALGLCPILGVSTLLCLGMLACTRLVRFEMHPAMALLTNMLAVPVELAMILPHMRVGEFVLRAEPLQVVKIRIADLWHGGLGKDLLLGVWHAIVGWLLLLPLETGAVALATLPLFKLLKKKFDQPLLGLGEWDEDDEALFAAAGGQGAGERQADGLGGRAARRIGGPPVIHLVELPPEGGLDAPLVSRGAGT